MIKDSIFTTKHTKLVSYGGIEMIERPPASVILSIDRDGDVIMIEQERGTFGKIFELPAGKVEKGENPQVCAERELLEETGYKANGSRKLISYYPSVGYTTEEIHCYVTEDLENTGIQRLDDGERVRVVNISFDEVMQMIIRGEIKDSKTIICMLTYISISYV